MANRLINMYGEARELLIEARINYGLNYNPGESETKDFWDRVDRHLAIKWSTVLKDEKEKTNQD